MSKIPKENIEEYKDSLGPLEQYIPGLDKIISGNEYHGRCPFCNELGDPNSPCFWVWTESQRYICRKCDAKGDIITYIEEKEGRSLAEQLREAGLSDHEEDNNKKEVPPKKKPDSGTTGRRTESRTPEEKKFDFIWGQGKDSSIPYKKYLEPARGIKLQQRSPVIRFNSYKGKDGARANVIMMALARPGDNLKKPQSMMRIFLKKEGEFFIKDSGIALNRKKGAQTGRAVWFFPDMDKKVVGHGEGQETMLAVHAATGMNVAASLTTSGINNIAFFPEQEKVFFFIDQDVPKWNSKNGKQTGCQGQSRGLKAALRAQKKGLDAWVVTPTEDTFTGDPDHLKKLDKVDFNDLLKDDQAGESIRARVEAAVKPEDVKWTEPPDKKVIGTLEETYPDGTLEQLEQINENYAACLVSGKFRIAREYLDPTMDFHTVDFLEIGSFNNFMRTNKTLVFSDNKGNTKVERLADVWMEWTGRRSYSSVVFDPTETVAEAYNIFRGFPVEPIKKEGGWKLFKAHMYNVLCNGREDYYAYLTAWMARIIQDPGGSRPGVAVVLKGGKGVGKGTFAYGFSKLFGESFVHLSSAKGLTGDFNMHLSKGLLVFADEAVWGGDKSSEGRLKAIITEPLMEFEPKGIDKQFLKCYINLLMASNEDWVCPATEDERRFFVLNVARKDYLNKEYFGAIRAELKNGGYEAMMYDLLHHDYSHINLRDAPKTEGLIDQVAESLGPELEFWFDVLERGYLLSEHNGAPKRTDYGNEQNYWPEVVWRHELKFEFQEKFMAKKRKTYSVTNKAFWTKTRKFWRKPEISRPRNAIGKQDQAVSIPPIQEMRQWYTQLTGIQFDEDLEEALSKVPF
jgi:hypothetical protein